MKLHRVTYFLYLDIYRRISFHCPFPSLCFANPFSFFKSKVCGKPPGGSVVKESSCKAGDLGSIPGLGRSPGGGHGNLLQYSCLENPMDRGAWWAIAHGVEKSQTRLSDWTELNCRGEKTRANKDTVLSLVAPSCPTLHDPMDCSPPGSFVHEDSPGKNTGVGCHALLQEIFLTQGSNSGLPHCRQILYHLSHQGSPRITE